MFIPELILQAFVVTVVSESLIVYLFFRKKFFSTLLTVVAVHCISHPLAMGLFYILGAGFWVAEGTVVLLESVLYFHLFKISYKRALLVALIANVSSVVVGYVLRLFLI